MYDLTEIIILETRINETKRFLLSLNKSINQDYLTIIVDDHPEKIT